MRAIGAYGLLLILVWLSLGWVLGAAVWRAGGMILFVTFILGAALSNFVKAGDS